jgi:hypothetical protein
VTAGVEPDEIAIGADDFAVEMVDPGVGDLQLPLRQTQHGELDRLGFIAEWGPDAFDFDERLAVSVNIPSGSCIPVLAGFDSYAGRTVRPRFVPPADVSTCNDEEQWPLYLVTIDRSAVAPWFVLEVPGSDRPGHTTRRLRVDIEPMATERHGLRPVQWEVLASSRVAVPLALAADDVELANLVAGFGSPAAASPAVDFDAEVVLAFAMTDGGCGSRITGIGLDGDLLTVVLEDAQLLEGAQPRAAGTAFGCTTDTYPVSHLVSLRRADLPDTFRIVHVPRDLGTRPPPATVTLSS